MLAFPEPGVDDTAAYQGYQTRFYRDSKNNTVQIYLQPSTARAVLVWADAANESVGFAVRDAAGRAARLEWASEAAEVSDSGRTRSIQFRLSSEASRIDLGWFVLGSMRIERDFVYAKRHLRPFTDAPFVVAEESLLVADVGRLPAAERQRQLALLNARTLAELRSRLEPTIDSASSDTGRTIRVTRPSLDGRNRLVLELRVDPRRVKVQSAAGSVSLQTRPGSPVNFSVRVTTDASPLTPISRARIFNRNFLGFIEGDVGETDSARVAHRRLERQVRAVELLSSEEKLMAGLPNFATYFGRDMMMTALMMRPIWAPEMGEHVIASVLRKLGPRGEVSHEEALGGQAIREHAVIYDSLITAYLRSGQSGQNAERTLERARDVLRNLQKTRENYHMVDDEFQLPVLAAWYLADSTITPSQKRIFLLERRDGVSRLTLLLRELALVASLTRPYGLQQQATNLVSFPRRDSTHWRSASWRDSDAGYSGGRFAMDINVIWAPKALESIASIFQSLAALKLNPQALAAGQPEIQSTPLAHYLRHPTALRRAIEAWKGARRHFRLTLSPAEIREHTGAKLSSLPVDEQQYWREVMTRQGEPRDSLTFLVLALDSVGRPIPVVNSDPSTELFLDADLTSDLVLEDLGPFLRPYPVGLFVRGLGPLVANDAYASRQVWERFQADHYHGPRVVWGREVNLLLLGLANQITAGKSNGLGDALRQTQAAVNASGLEHNELWSYEIKGGKLRPVRYGTSSDVQLWNTTNLVVQYVLSQLK